MTTLPEEAVKAAYSAYVTFIEEGGAVPVIDAVRAALTAALPFLSVQVASAAREMALEEAAIFEALEECETYFENRSDADHDEAGFVPNEEMRILVSVRAAISALASHPVADKPDEAGAQGEVTAAARDVLAERSRQIEAEGWTTEHDDQHSNGEMARASACYALNNAANWPWSISWWKPSDRRRNLVKAGALIIAEIERLDRLPTPPSSEVA